MRCDQAAKLGKKSDSKASHQPSWLKSWLLRPFGPSNSLCNQPSNKKNPHCFSEIFWQRLNSPPWKKLVLDRGNSVPHQPFYSPDKKGRRTYFRCPHQAGPQTQNPSNLAQVDQIRNQPDTYQHLKILAMSSKVFSTRSASQNTARLALTSLRLKIKLHAVPPPCQIANFIKFILLRQSSFCSKSELES